MKTSESVASSIGILYVDDAYLVLTSSALMNADFMNLSAFSLKLVDSLSRPSSTFHFLPYFFVSSWCVPYAYVLPENIMQIWSHNDSASASKCVQRRIVLPCDFILISF